MIVQRAPSTVEYQRLRDIIGCDRIDDSAVEIGLSRSLFAVCALSEGEVIGCGRVVGDDGLYFFIQDLMVDPRHDNEGIEACLMDEIMEYLKKAAPPNAFFCIKGCHLQREHCKQYGFHLTGEDKDNGSL